MPSLIGFSILLRIRALRCCSLASSSGVTFAMDSSKALMNSRSTFRSCSHDGRSMSARFIFTLPPISASSGTGISSSSASRFARLSVQSETLPASPATLNELILLRVRVWLSCRLFRVSRKASTELSRRLSRLVVINACRLRSRSACFSFPLPPSTCVSYRSSYFLSRLGRM